jgi:Cu/Ag efflux protein CusF
MSGAMNDMGNMDMPANMPMRTAKGSGTVTAIDKSAGSITLDHGPIPEANWPAMTMAFKVKPELLDSVKVGDKVVFDLALKDGSGEVTAVQKQ